MSGLSAGARATCLFLASSEQGCSSSTPAAPDLKTLNLKLQSFQANSSVEFNIISSSNSVVVFIIISS